MADGMNEARAMRVVELLADFRACQVHIAEHVQNRQNAPPDADATRLRGYTILTQCRTLAQQLLNDIGNVTVPRDPENTEAARRDLQRIILDASARRFKAHMIYLKVAVVVRWIIQRRSLAQRTRQSPDLNAALARVDRALDQELTTINAEYVYRSLRAADVQRTPAIWIAEDPTLQQLTAYIQRAAR